MTILNKFLELQTPAKPNKKAHLTVMLIFSVAFIILSMQLENNVALSIFAGMLLFWQRYLVLEVSSLKQRLSKHEDK